MELLPRLLASLRGWTERAFPAEAETEPGRSIAEPADAEDGEPLRQSIRDVTLEQLGIAHWSCHTHF